MTPRRWDVETACVWLLGVVPLVGMWLVPWLWVTGGLS